MSILAGASGVVISGNSSINAYSGDVTNNYTHTTNRIKDSFNSNQTSYENSGNDNSQRYNGGGSYSSYSSSPNPPSSAGSFQPYPGPGTPGFPFPGHPGTNAFFNKPPILNNPTQNAQRPPAVPLAPNPAQWQQQAAAQFLGTDPQGISGVTTISGSFNNSVKNISDAYNDKSTHNVNNIYNPTASQSPPMQHPHSPPAPHFTPSPPTPNHQAHVQTPPVGVPHTPHQAPAQPQSDTRAHSEAQPPAVQPHSNGQATAQPPAAAEEVATEQPKTLGQTLGTDPVPDEITALFVVTDKAPAEGEELKKKGFRHSMKGFFGLKKKDKTKEGAES